jgi:DNA uptake protein ComE-like DNA-binding protein
MNILKKWVRNVFGFSGKEINGFLILLPLMVILIASEPVYRMWITNRTDDFSADRHLLDSLAQLWKTVPSRDTALVTSLFDFNPNKVSVTDMQRLGFSESLSTRIANYRQKGGQFRIKADLMKIYGMDSTLYAQLYAYILLPEEKEKFSDEQHEKTATQSRKTLLTSFDLNQADTTELKSVYGIGSKLASRIIRFREGLGGFVKEDQLKEVYGLDTTVIHHLLKISFIAEDFTPRKINLNTADETEFSAHPYIKKFKAKAIIAYRFQHGSFADVQELKKLTLFKTEEADKIIPYLKIAE